MEKYILDELEKNKNNIIEGELYTDNSQIKFVGKNNILYVDGSVRLVNSSIEFRGDNSIIYICNTKDKLELDIKVYNNSALYFGKDLWINKKLKIVLSEETNAFFGNECLISYDTCLRTGDPHLIYDVETYKRINKSKSFYVGDHVWIGQHVMMLKGAQIGSGTVVGAMSLIPSKKLSSNCVYAGNPIKKVKSNIFFLRENCHYFTKETSREYDEYLGNEYIYEKDENTLSFDKIEDKLKHLKVHEKLIFLKEITNNNSKNRFFMG